MCDMSSSAGPPVLSLSSRCYEGISDAKLSEHVERQAQGLSPDPERGALPISGGKRKAPV
jgi:hypothetical protein